MSQSRYNRLMKRQQEQEDKEAFRQQTRQEVWQQAAAWMAQCQQQGQMHQPSGGGTSQWQQSWRTAAFCFTCENTLFVCVSVLHLFQEKARQHSLQSLTQVGWVNHWCFHNILFGAGGKNTKPAQSTSSSGGHLELLPCPMQFPHR